MTDLFQRVQLFTGLQHGHLINSKTFPFSAWRNSWWDLKFVCVSCVFYRVEIIFSRKESDLKKSIQAWKRQPLLINNTTRQLWASSSEAAIAGRGAAAFWSLHTVKVSSYFNANQSLKKQNLQLRNEVEVFTSDSNQPLAAWKFERFIFFSGL